MSTSFCLSIALWVFILSASKDTLIDIIKGLSSTNYPTNKLCPKETYCDFNFLSMDMENVTENQLYKYGH